MLLSCDGSAVYVQNNTVIIRSLPFRANTKINVDRKPINLLI